MIAMVAMPSPKSVQIAIHGMVPAFRLNRVSTKPLGQYSSGII